MAASDIVPTAKKPLASEGASTDAILLPAQTGRSGAERRQFGAKRSQMTALGQEISDVPITKVPPLAIPKSFP
jgi:hypothetical protein